MLIIPSLLMRYTCPHARFVHLLIPCFSPSGEGDIGKFRVEFGDVPRTRTFTNYAFIQHILHLFLHILS
jgi:hypothetical protein